MKKKAIDENLIIANGKCIGAHSWTFPTNQSYIAEGTPCDCRLKRYEVSDYLINAIKSKKGVYNTKLSPDWKKKIIEEEKENAFNVLMECMPLTAESIATIVPQDARKMLQDFVKKYWH